MRRAIPLLGIGVLGVAGAMACSKTETVEPEHEAATTETLEPHECGAITRLHTLGGVFLASQPGQGDFAEVKECGVKTVINLRHPAEVDFDEKQIVEAEGLLYVNLPFGGAAELTDAVLDELREQLRTAERPILLHCASANRVGAVWLPYRVLDGGLSYEQALVEARTVGLKSPDLEERAREYIEHRK